MVGLNTALRSRTLPARAAGCHTTTQRGGVMFGKWLRRHAEANQSANGIDRHGDDHLIELRDVLKVYETAAGKFTALKRIDLAIGRGEFVAIIGKSGSGKSTLINMITGI